MAIIERWLNVLGRTLGVCDLEDSRGSRGFGSSYSRLQRLWESDASSLEFSRGSSGFVRALEEPPRLSGNQRNASQANSKVLSIASSLD